MKRISIITIFITLSICLGYTVQNRWKAYNGDAWRSTIASDGYGYYAYLPCIFIYHSFDYIRVLNEEQKIRPGANGVTSTLPQNKLVDKYFSGVAILLVPFFLIAYLFSIILGYSTGGYEFLFQASVSIGALFYLAVGLIFLRKLLKIYSISEAISCLTILLIVFGTNLLYYSTLEPSMSHVYSFGVMAAFLFYTKKSMDDFRLKYLVPMVISISILMLIRPTNILCLAFIPFIAGSMKSTLSYIIQFKNNKKSFILLSIAAGILFIQPLLWYLQTERFFIWSYPGESFNFNDPHFIDILFSYRKGWFIYTPLMFIAILGGLVALCRQSIFRFFCALLFFLLVTYILSSWWSWWYGGSFGSRAFIDFYSIFALFLALFLNSLTSQWLRIPIILITFFCVWLNIFQTNQDINFILPCDGLTKEKYWKIFLEKDPSYSGLFDYPDTTHVNFLNNYTFKNDFEQNNTWGNNQNITAAYAHSGVKSVFINEKNQYSPVLELKASALPQSQSLAVYVKLWAYMPNFNNNAIIIVSIQTEKGECYLWATKNIQGFVFNPNEWSQAYTLIDLPAFKNPTDELKVYVLNTEDIMYIDDMEVIFGTPK